MKTKISRIPSSLDKVCDLFSREYNEPIRVKSFDLIAETAKGVLFDMKKVQNNMLKNKKGQIIELFAFSFVLLVVVLFFAISGTSMNSLNEYVNESSDSSMIAIQPEVNTFVTNIPGWIDFAIGAFFFLYLIALFLINFFLGSNIVFAVFYFLSMFFFGSIIKMFAQSMTVMQGSSLGTFIAQLPITSFIFNNFYVIMILFFILMLVFLFGKPTARASI